MHFGTFLAQTGGHTSVVGLVLSSGWFAKLVLVLLLAASVWSWAIIVERWRLFSRIRREDQTFLGSFRMIPPGTDLKLVTAQHPNSLLARVALAGQRALEQHPAEGGLAMPQRMEFAQRAMDRAANDESARLERHVGFLATVGSVAPFVGLMGTVWGVMTAFLDIGSQGSASLIVVAPGIAEALIATIAGLAAAIPAVVGYNHLLQRLRDIANETAKFISEYLDRVAGARS